MIKIITHDAKFHTDDVFAVATLFLALGKENCEIIRTREEGVIASGDYVVDVGGIYDAEKNRFDHHQIDGAGQRESRVPYASFGLVWKKFGKDLVGSEELASKIDDSLVSPIDAIDNGVDIAKPLIDGLFQYDINNIVNLYRPTWKENPSYDENFLNCVDWAAFVLRRLIKITQDSKEAIEIIQDTYKKTGDKRIIVFNEKDDLGREIITSVLSDFEEPVYSIVYRSDAKNWQVIAMRKKDSFESKKALPIDWRGKRGDEINVLTRIKDGVFCHRGGFMCVVGSKESALKLAEMALNA